MRRWDCLFATICFRAMQCMVFVWAQHEACKQNWKEQVILMFRTHNFHPSRACMFWYKNICNEVRTFLASLYTGSILSNNSNSNIRIINWLQHFFERNYLKNTEVPLMLFLPTFWNWNWFKNLEKEFKEILGLCTECVGWI